jgi:hypothetical protein
MGKGKQAVKSREEIQKLKDEWAKDPCWDIEATVGFEDHIEELLAFSELMKQKWLHDERQAFAQKVTAAKALDAILEARLAALDCQWKRATAWAAIAQAEATQRIALASATDKPMADGTARNYLRVYRISG